MAAQVPDKGTNAQKMHGKAHEKDISMALEPVRLPESHLPYTDKYFIRSRQILEKERMDPQVCIQVFIRNGPGRVFGISEAARIIKKYTGCNSAGTGNSNILGGSVKVWGLEDGSIFEPEETLMLIQGRLQNIIELETMYLGSISSATTIGNRGKVPDLEAIKNKAAMIRSILPDKQLMYFGARHWHFSMDAAISKAAVDGGFDSCSTDIGARAAGIFTQEQDIKKADLAGHELPGHGGGVGTMPHALVVAFAGKYGIETATLKATEAFDRHISPKVARVSLIDTFNREITDTLMVAGNISSLQAIRVDTAGEILGEGAIPEQKIPQKDRNLPESRISGYDNICLSGSNHTKDGKDADHIVGHCCNRYMHGNGVSISLVRAIRTALDCAGHIDVNIVLSSGFGDLEKMKAFVEDEKKHGRLFESVGIGGLFDAWSATADIVMVGGKELSKTGRRFKPNSRLKRLL